jgi:protein TonB
MKEKSEIKENSTGKKAEEEKIEPPSANSEKELKTESENKISTKLLPLYQPLPEIPDDLRQEAFDSFAVARFYISQNGIVTKVDLLTPCKNSKLNQLLLKSLYNWKFNPSIKPWTQDIRVTFKVE